MADYTLSAQITGDSSGLQKAVSTAEKAVSSFEKKMSTVSKTLDSVGKAMSDAGKKITLVETAIAGVGVVGIKYNATMEQYATSFEVMTGSAEKAAETVDKLKDIAASTPFEMPDLAETTQLLMNYGFTADDALEKMQMLGDISQGSAEKMQRIATAYGQMSSAGKVQLEDIKQMIEAGFNPLQEITESTGESMASLYDRISAGTISVDEITAAMVRSTSEGGKYFQSMDKQSQTLSGQLSTLKDNAQSLLGNLTTGVFEKLANDIVPKINEALDKINTAFESGGFQGAIDAIRQMSPVLDTIIGGFERFKGVLDSIGINPAMFAGIVAASGPVIAILGKITSAVGGVTGVIGKMGSAFGALSGPAKIVTGVLGALAAGIAYLMATNSGFRESIMNVVSAIGSSLAPILPTLLDAFSQIGNVLASTVMTVLQALAPVIQQIAELIAQVMAILSPIISQLISALAPAISAIVAAIGQVLTALAPLISQLVSALAPIITAIANALGPIVNALLPVIITIINGIAAAIQALIPIIQNIVNFVGTAISTIISVIRTIIGVVASVFSTVYNTVSNVIGSVVDFISNAIDTVSNVVSKIAGFFQSAFEAAKNVVETIIGGIQDVFTGFISAVEGAWNGLTAFVGGIFDGIASAFNSLIDGIKGAINVVISAINGAIWVINLIPGVNIPEIPKLLHGTDDWQGGFAVMNEAGRGELTYLPNGAQVIPHDISVKYAKEAARANTTAADSYNPGYFVGALASALKDLAKRPVYTVLEVDGRTFGAATARYITPAQQKAAKIQNMVNGVK